VRVFPCVERDGETGTDLFHDTNYSGNGRDPAE
jgi:hypothetical protein